MGLCLGKEAADTQEPSTSLGPQQHGAVNGQPAAQPTAATHTVPQDAAGTPPPAKALQEGQVFHNPLVSTPAVAPAPNAPPPTPPNGVAPPPALAPRSPPSSPSPPTTAPTSNGTHHPHHHHSPTRSPTPEPHPTTHPSPKPAAPRPQSAAAAPADPHPPPPDHPSPPAASHPSFMSALFVKRTTRDPSKPPPSGRLTELPQPLLVHLLSLLDLPQATLLSCTCHHLRALVTDNALWQSQILARLHAAAARVLLAPHPLPPPGPPSSSATDLYIPYTTPSPPSNGFMRHRAPRRPAQHAPGERWADAAAALLPPTSQCCSDDQLLHTWQQVMAAAPLQHLQGLYHYLATGATCTRPLLKRDAGLQATFPLVLPGHYEVVWHLRLKHPKVSQAGHMRFDTSVTYHHLHGEAASAAEYGNKSTVWNGAQLSTLEHKHGRGSWAAVVVTALKVDRLCQTEVAVKGMDECSGIWVRRVQLRRVVPVDAPV